MKEQIYKIRPHHGLCLFFFKGKGYSNDFIINMIHVKNILMENPLVCITSQPDIICVKCPNLISGLCATQDKVTEYDRKVLTRCNISDGIILPYHDFRTLILDHIIAPGKREDICGNCQWTTLCHNPEYMN